VTSDRDRVIRFWSLGAEWIFGNGPAEALGHSLWTFLFPSDSGRDIGKDIVGDAERQRWRPALGAGSATDRSLRSNSTSKVMLPHGQELMVFLSNFSLMLACHCPGGQEFYDDRSRRRNTKTTGLALPGDSTASQARR
jgi:hypothetical protein